MDLKTFAVNRKLVYDYKLLDYVAKEKPVPCDVLEESFKEVIGPMEDAKSTMLIEDYPRMLREEVPIICKRDPNSNEYHISGEVPDPILEAIYSVHDVTPEEAITLMIKENMQVLNNQTAEVSALSLNAQAERLLMQSHSIPPVQDVSALLEEPVTESIKEPIKESVADLPNDTFQDFESDVQKKLNKMNQRVEANAQILNETKASVEQVPRVPRPDEYIPEAHPQIEDKPETMITETNTNEAEEISAFDEDSELFAEEAAQEDLRKKLKQVYAKLKEDIKSLNLDTALNLAI